MPSSESSSIVIAGAGLAGALLAAILGRRGHRVEVFERRGDPRGRGFIGGRSINLALSARGLAALDRVGLSPRVLAEAIPMRGRMMHAVDGELAFQPYSKNASDAIHSVSRGGLNLALLEAADAMENVTLHFGHRCADLDLDDPAITFATDDGGTVTRRADAIVGADGAFSAVRGRLQRTDRFDYSQTYLGHGYKELTIPPTADGAFAMDPNALHIWPRGGFMMIALPNQDRTFTCTLFWPFDGPNGFAGLDTPEAIRRRFEAQFGDAVPLMPTLVEDFQRNPVSSLVTVRCCPWHHESGVILVGDAAHAIVPFYGQGMNAAFEDCAALDDLLAAHGPDWATVMPAYTEARKANGDAIADLALANFIEMRDKVGSPAFRAKKRLEKTLHRLLPRWYTPLYNMVSFSTIPYAEARERAARANRALGVAVVIVLVLLLALVVAAVGAMV